MPAIASFKNVLIIFVFALISLTVYNNTSSEPEGPGMITTEQTYDSGILIEPILKRFPNGTVIKHISPLRRKGGSTEGGSNDSRTIPEWVEYEWKEVSYYEKDSRTIEEQIAELHAAPIKRQRVMIASRIPSEVIQEAIESVKNRAYGQLPDKKIWLYFTWYKGHIYLSWQFEVTYKDQTTKITHSGGDTCKDGQPIPDENSDKDCF